MSIAVDVGDNVTTSWITFVRNWTRRSLFRFLFVFLLSVLNASHETTCQELSSLECTVYCSKCMPTICNTGDRDNDVGIAGAVFSRTRCARRESPSITCFRTCSGVVNFIATKMAI